MMTVGPDPLRGVGAVLFVDRLSMRLIVAQASTFFPAPPAKKTRAADSAEFASALPVHPLPRAGQVVARALRLFVFAAGAGM
jgi:hypothetical protein